MKRSQGVLAVVAVLVAVVNGRVYYLQNADENRYGDLSYPTPNEQSSRDLDLSFSAGDANEADEVLRPAKKVYTLVTPEKVYGGQTTTYKEELPIARYKLVEAPVRRTNLDDVIVLPGQGRRTVKIDGNNKGEVVVELRVIANHDSD
ncbi:uncharacterized protein LOC143177235 [Calliopsis andreniformis]|uniref:uncharacterized protein LOC143177235 n=1 Tax=Calliopsis andreniformis TaxID=337506 RepID=UPI003FCD6FA3